MVIKLGILQCNLNWNWKRYDRGQHILGRNSERQLSRNAVITSEARLNSAEVLKICTSLILEKKF